MLAILGLLIAGAVWLVQRYRPTPKLGPSPTPPQLARERTERATVVFGPERGSGTLRLTPSQLVFTGDSGRIVVVERITIVGVSVTTELPDGSVASPVLAVTTRTEALYLSVADPARWAASLN
jgi:hypothetical protein